MPCRHTHGTKDQTRRDSCERRGNGRGGGFGWSEREREKSLPLLCVRRAKKSKEETMTKQARGGCLFCLVFLFCLWAFFAQWELNQGNTVGSCGRYATKNVFTISQIKGTSRGWAKCPLKISSFVTTGQGWASTFSVAHTLPLSFLWRGHQICWLKITILLRAFSVCQSRICWIQLSQIDLPINARKACTSCRGSPYHWHWTKGAHFFVRFAYLAILLHTVVAYFCSFCYERMSCLGMKLLRQEPCSN